MLPPLSALAALATLATLAGCDAILHSLNSSEYRRLPPLYALDDYEACMQEPGATYCLVDLRLSAAPPSPLMHLLYEYSADTKKHFDHTTIHRGVCVAQSCGPTNRTQDLNASLEACLNESLWRGYGLHARLHQVRCERAQPPPALDASDLAVLLLYMLLVALNLIGSLYDLLFCQPNTKSGNSYALAFSLRRNWAKLMAPSGAGPDPRVERLRSFQGLRAMTMVCVIFSHSALVMGNGFIHNPLYAEKAFEDPIKQILFNGNLVTHTFFVMSSFLLAYNFQISAEKHKISWWHLPKGIFMRWIRLTPTYGLVLATVATLVRHMGGGPLWQWVVGAEARACRRFWWAHLLYVHNYLLREDKCMMVTWYLAADTQLFCLGLALCLAFRSWHARRAALAATFALSLLITAATTYYRDLDAVVIQSPEASRTAYEDNDTFYYMYVLGHTNLSTYTLGLGGGFLVYNWQKLNKNMDHYKKYRWVVWSLVPLGVLLILSGGMFYSDDWTPPRAFQIVYATLYKPMFQLLVVLLIISCVFKLETVYRPIVEWRGFSWCGRLTYGAYLLHMVFQKGLVGSQRQPTFMTDYNVMVLFAATVMMAFLTAAPLWLFVEAPMAALTKAAFTRTPKRFDSQ